MVEIHADDFTIYLKQKRNNKAMNLMNVQEVMRVVELFYMWSGMKVNREKTYSTILGESLGQPEYVEQLRIK